ncbi:T9SS type B sorting domain-containing protein [Flavobacterium restrictum]|uniref:T9SS type B sorting domain-containing protein n=1 Tax=Flavobacterium restrictum TaxID=2594428 RepID=A0A553E8I2_9FLAO|nr:T9SS type B sorting domain-containing protein [Flavobacterium restrictum]TRX41336.1 T9SS type B sorting domain-containing protein [Flavobacterium restrictum]
MNIFKFIVSTLLFFSIPAFSQKEAANWYFGNNAGLDFNSGSPVAVTNGQLYTAEGCTTISDKNGNLLFYTDGTIVYDKLHQVMPNGFGLLGHNSSTQSAIIVPKPGNPNFYYIFTVDEPNPKNVDDNPLNDQDPPNNGLNYSLVDLRLNGGQGDIVATEKNVPLTTYNPNDSEEVKYKSSEKITAVQHSDGISFWVITHFKNNFYAFKIDTKGVDKKPIVTTTPLNIPTGGYIFNAIGYLKASPNGKKVAIANTATRPTSELGPKNEIKRNTGNVWLFDFDAQTGKLTNGLSLLSGSNPYGLEFSAKSKKLYVTINKFDTNGVTLGSSLLQFNLKSANIATSNTTVNSSSNVAGALQLAIDEKIYRSGYPFSSDGSDHLSVINNPELDGTACNFLQNQISLNGKVARLGLPPFITSLFLYAFSYEFNCLGQSTHFFVNSVEKIDSVLWDFGDGTTATTLDAHHIYKTPGDYKVTLIKTINGETREPLEKTITIYETPKVLATTHKLVQCDTQDAFPMDGLSTFNLALANEPIALGNKDYDVFYYHSINEADADKTNTESLPLLYQNTIPDEIVYAKVTQPNSSCYSLATVILHANKNNDLQPSSFHACDLGNANASFNLELKKATILTELNLPADVRLFFYENPKDAALGTNELIGSYISIAKTIFIRAENNDGCYGTGQLQLLVDSTPVILPSENRILCEDDATPLLLNAGLTPPNTPTDYTFLWSTSETTPTISVTKEGDYSVTVTNKSGCTATRVCKVTLSHLAKINSIAIQDLQPNNQITVNVTNPDNYLYAIKYQNGNTTALQNSPVFDNVPGGFHELIIKNKEGNCGPIFQSVAVLEAPFYFTPNNDGYNDYWNLKGINSPIYKNAVIYIFDRYGKLIKQLSPNSIGWDGTYNKAPLPSDDYWFTIKLEEGREAKGHFSLKR